MGGKRIDYAIERQRHEAFVGRAALLVRLDLLLIATPADRWVVVTGGPGMGKSAVLAEWLRQREAAGTVVPHHFIRRGEYDWDDPARLVSSLIAQIEERFPDQREPVTDEQKHPSARLAEMLTRVSAARLAPAGERLVILIDGLDEYDPPVGSPVGDPLAAFLPHALPRGVSFLCASRPRHPYLSMLESRDGELVRIDLDDPAAADNHATVRSLWERAAPPLGLDARFIDAAVTRAGGNLQHAVTLRKRLAGLPLAQRRVEAIPRGLEALLIKLWRRMATDAVAVTGLGILCAAREALTLDELGAVAGWTDEAQRRAFMTAAAELLVETRRTDESPEYRLHHDAIRAYIASTLGADVVRGHHAALSRELATWPAPANASARRYSLRHGLTHRAEAGDWADVWRLAADMSFLEAKCRELGAYDLEADVARAAERCRASGDEATGRRLVDLARALGRESHWLRDAPEATAALVWNRLRRSGWRASELADQLRIAADTAFLRVRHGATRESPALVRDLVGHTGVVRACAVTPDGRHVISASGDRTLKAWDLETGRVIVTFEGHTHEVAACAVTPDGRRVISASRDGTLTVWDLGSGCALATLEGHTSSVNACAVTPDGRRVISASTDRALKIWDLDSEHALATLEGHTSSVNACAITLDGRRVVSASEDRTLMVWDVDRSDLLAVLEGHDDGVTACAVTPDGRRVVSASKDHTLKVWDLDRSRILATFEGHTDGVTACAVTPDGRRVISAFRDRTLDVRDLDSGHVLATLEGHADWVRACAVTPDGRRVVSASNDQTLKVWSFEGGRAPSIPGGHADQVRACAVTPDGRRVVSASRDGTLKVWDLDTGRPLATFEGHVSWVRACAVTSDGRRVVSASRDGTLKVWEFDSGRVLATLEGHAGPVTACAVTPDHRYVISASLDKTMKLWDLDSGQVLATLRGHTGWVTACAVTPDGRRVVSTSIDQTLKVWGLESSQVLATLKGHTGWVTACAVTPDGRRVVSASSDKTLKVWDLDHMGCLLTHRSDASCTAIAVTATGIAAGDVAGTVWFLDWPASWGPAHIAGPLGDAVRSLPAELRQLRPASDLAARVVATSDHQRLRSTSSAWISSDSHAPPLGPPGQPVRRHVILFLAANPSGTSRLALDEECAAIERELRMTTGRDDFDFRSKWAVSVDEMMRHLNELQPTILHFSGHGGGSAHVFLQDQPSRQRDLGVAASAAIQLQGEQREPQHVSARALSQMIRSAAPSTRIVVLNACFSDAMIEALCGSVDCVVGMRGAIGDDAARSFAVGFYRALGYRRSVGNAIAQAVATLAAKQLPDEHLPVYRIRNGIRADQVFLADLGLPRPRDPVASRAAGEAVERLSAPSTLWGSP